MSILDVNIVLDTLKLDISIKGFPEEGGNKWKPSIWNWADICYGGQTSGRLDWWLWTYYCWYRAVRIESFSNYTKSNQQPAAIAPCSLTCCVPPIGIHASPSLELLARQKELSFTFSWTFKLQNKPFWLASPMVGVTGTTLSKPC